MVARKIRFPFKTDYAGGGDDEAATAASATSVAAAAAAAENGIDHAYVRRRKERCADILVVSASVEVKVDLVCPQLQVKRNDERVEMPHS